MSATEAPPVETEVDASQPLTDGDQPVTDVAAADQPSSDAPPSDGRPRDERGRFAPKTPGAEGSQDGTQTSDAAALDGPAATGTPPATDLPAADAPASTATAEPFVLNVAGQQYPIPGLTVAPESHKLVHELLGLGVVYREKREAIQQERQSLRAERLTIEAEKAKNAVVGAQIDELLGLVDRGEIEAAQQWLVDFVAKVPLLRERAEIAKERAAIEMQRQLGQPTDDEQIEQANQHADQQLTTWLTLGKTHPGADVLTAEDFAALKTEVEANPEYYFGRASEDLPQHGLKAGDWFGHTARFRTQLEQRIAWRQEIKKAKAEAAKLSTVKAANDAKTKPTISAPPAPGAVAAVAKPGEKKLPTNWTELNEAIGL
jgi:hypothetical protein